MSLFKRRRFPVEIILLCVRWYCKYGISYCDLAEMMQERGVEVDPSTIFRWFKRVIRPPRGFQSMKTARATIRGFEVMRKIRRGHGAPRQPGVTGEIRLVGKLFGLAA